jgi:hypothetical protein
MSRKPEPELRKLLAKEFGFVGDGWCLLTAGPAERMRKNDKSNQRLARGLGQHGKSACSS